MANDFYTPSGSPSTSSKAVSSTMRSEFESVEDGFDKLPGLTGNGSLPIFVNSGATALEAVSAANARTALGLAIGTNVQAYDAGLLSIAALTTAADKMIYTTASDTYAVTALTSFARTILDDTNAAGVIATLGLDADIATLSLPASTTISDFAKTILDDTTAAGVIATLGLDADIATLSLPASTTISAYGKTLIDDADAGTAQATLELVIGTNVQAQDAGLQSIADLTTEANKMIYATASDTYATTSLTAFARTILDDADAGAVRTTIGALGNVSEDTTPELSGELDCGAHSVGFDLGAITGSGATTIDWKISNNRKFTWGAAGETFTFTAPSNPCHLTLIMTQDGTGGRDATWPAAVTWLGTEPTWTNGGASKTIVVSFIYDGTTYWGAGTDWES